MRLPALFFCILLMASCAFSQPQKKVFYKKTASNSFRFIPSDEASADCYALVQFDAATQHTRKIFYTLTHQKDYYGSFLNDTLPDGLFVSYYANGYTSDSGYYDKGVKKSNWFYYHPNGKLAAEVRYKKDQMGFIQCLSESGKPDTNCIPEVMATYPGGVPELSAFLARNIEIPVEARKKGVIGEVIVRFYIDTDGTVRDPQVVKDHVGNGCAKEAIRVVKLMPRWTPAKQFNRRVKVYYTLPIGFRHSN